MILCGAPGPHSPGASLELFQARGGGLRLLLQSRAGFTRRVGIVLASAWRGAHRPQVSACVSAWFGFCYALGWVFPECTYWRGWGLAVCRAGAIGEQVQPPEGVQLGLPR